VLAKFGVHSRLQLAALASRDGLLIEQLGTHPFSHGHADHPFAPRIAAVGENLSTEAAM